MTTHSDDFIEDDEVDFHVEFLQRWFAVPCHPPVDEVAWAKSVIRESNNGSLPANADALAEHFVRVADMARSGVLPEKDFIQVYQPLPDGPVVAIMTIAAVPIEYVAGPLEERARTLALHRAAVLQEEECYLIDLPVGRSARWQGVQRHEAEGSRFWKRQRLFERVLYLIQPAEVDDFRILVNAWWEELALGPGILPHIEKIVGSVRFSPIGRGVQNYSRHHPEVERLAKDEGGGQPQ